MSAKTMSSLQEENRDLRKQIGCMNGIFQIFDRHHFLTGRRISTHTNKRLLQGSQHQLDQPYATKTVKEKDVEVQKEKPRMSTESSSASFSSSSCSSTFSSLDTIRTAQPETLPLRQINFPDTKFHKENSPSSAKARPSHDLRDVVKDSTYREARSLSIKSHLSNDERRGTVMKHVDSPRPPQQSKIANLKPTGSTLVLAKVQEGTKHSERLSLPRFSYDGRDSRETYKSSMKLKELPRLSLDSKTGTMRSFESRLSFLGHAENGTSYQEPETHSRTSSIVAKLMGLETFPDTISTDEIRTPTMKSPWLSKSTSNPEDIKQNQVNHSPRFSPHSPASPSPKLQSATFSKKPTASSRFPVEPAPWRQQESSPKMAPKNRKAPTNTLQQTCSVYGEIEKRIAELEFKKSGKDLRALKQILGAMQKTREPLQDQRGESAEFTLQRRCSLEDSCSDLSLWNNRKDYHQVPSIKGPCTTKQPSPVVIMKPAKMMERSKLSSRVPAMEIPHLQRLQTRTPRYKASSVQSQKTNDLTSENVRYSSCHLLTADKNTPQHMKSENCTTPGRSSGIVSPRVARNLFGQSQPTTLSSDSGRVKRQSGKKVVERGSQNRKGKVKTKDQQLSEDQLSELSSDTRYSSYQGDTASVKSESNNSLMSHTETEISSLAHSIDIAAPQKEISGSTTSKHIPAVESAISMLEQPSPISVLDDTFYCEDSPSPVKKISTVFQEDESPSPEEAEWHLETLNLLTRSNHCFKYNLKLGSTKHSHHVLTLLNDERDGSAADHNGSLNPDHRYINKILLTSGLLKDSNVISATDQLLSSRHLINPGMFDLLEQTEEIREAINGAAEKNDGMKLNNRIRRKIIFDIVDEILVHKITSGRSFIAGRKGTSPHTLLKEVYSEVDRVCSLPDCNLDEEDDMIRLLTADMMHQSDDWVSYTSEVPALVLDIERLIFKNLINELITGVAMDLHDWPKRHCRKLFTN